MTRFQDKVVLITGATSGIGKAAAFAFAREGAKLVLAGRREAEGQSIVADIRDQGREALFIKTDVTKDDEVRRLVESAVKRFGRIDVAFNNAGVEGPMGADLDALAAEDYRAVFDANLGGVFFAMRHEITAMLKSGGGAIVNTASIFSQIASPGMSLYGASKHAVLGLTRAAAVEYATRNIRINALSPGGVETEMMQRAAGAPEAESDGRRYFRNFHPMKRFSTPDEQAQAALFLASDQASFVNGANLAVDSGWSIA